MTVNSSGKLKASLVRIMRKVPIRNIYNIVLYAWGNVKHKNIYQHKSIEKIGSLNEVLVDMFLTEVERLTKAGLRKEYMTNIHESRFIKGKIHINKTIRKTNRMIVSEYDEFKENHLLNQLLKVFLDRIYYTENIDRKRVGRLMLHFSNVDLIKLTHYKWKSVQYNRLTKHYQFPLGLGKIIYEHSIPAEDNEKFIFHHIMENEETMSTLFEKFILNYYDYHYDYEVKSRRYNWELLPIEESNWSLIPRMETDIQIMTDNEQIVIDAKYYRSAFVKSYGKERFRSSHMYQLKTYMDKIKESSPKVRGILIYPSNGYDFYEQYKMKDGSIIAFKTINLAKQWHEIEADLAAIFK